MDKITIICAVAAEFKMGSEVFHVSPKERNLVLQAPIWIQNTRMFKWLSEDGSLKFVTPANKIQMENAPTLGLNAEGKAMKAEEAQTKEEAIISEVAEVIEEPVKEEKAEEAKAEPKKTRSRKAATTEE